MCTGTLFIIIIILAKDQYEKSDCLPNVASQEEEGQKVLILKQWVALLALLALLASLAFLAFPYITRRARVSVWMREMSVIGWIKIKQAGEKKLTTPSWEMEGDED